MHLKGYEKKLPRLDSDEINSENLSQEERDHLRLYTSGKYKGINIKLLSGESFYCPQIHRINRGIINSSQIGLPDLCFRIVHLKKLEYDAHKISQVFIKRHLRLLQERSSGTIFRGIH